MLAFDFSRTLKMALVCAFVAQTLAQKINVFINLP